MDEREAQMSGDAEWQVLDKRKKNISRPRLTKWKYEQLWNASGCFKDEVDYTVELREHIPQD